MMCAYTDSREAYTVVENTPGYLPEEDEPATFESLDDARVYASDRLSSLMDSIYDAYFGDPDALVPIVSGSFQSDLVVTVYDANRTHDLGRVIEIIES